MGIDDTLYFVKSSRGFEKTAYLIASSRLDAIATTGFGMPTFWGHMHSFRGSQGRLKFGVAG